MTATDIYCPSCGHHLFQADIGQLIGAPEPPAAASLLGTGTEVAAALLHDFFVEQSRVVRVANGRVLQADLIEAFNTWAIARGSNPQSASAIGRGLRVLGIQTAKSQGRRFYLGVAFTHAPA